MNGERSTLWPRRLRSGLGLAAGVLLTVCAVQAEMSGDDYGSTTRLTSPEERRRVEADLEQARERAAAEEATRQRVETQRQTLEAQRLSMRPLGERLLDSRCTACHALNVLDHNVKSPLAWRWTVERMRWWHGAQLSTEEVRQVSAHLTLARAGGLGWVDAGIVIGLLAVPGCGGLGWMGYRRKRSLRKESI
ncbi:MAG: hypothetical protein Q8S96_15855 [Hydrogenophaga sp.]|uniref:hypothetical protein n=1 Tax=Hydrogenophaga sp. TaxID=1904254 RepID=UPI0027276CA4|nr:hypothetical protein [Hydrogenophaga sp.]MDO9568255.1 hypothetical protein [Hydrogenophaga sp.]MDP3345911.1 hypothetical protein [Hydrogenophaga sp.]MDP3923800.1 hypothetical protein [Hydrogenophaga sp.]MDZ4294313.1 hypothetical protein [Hydrogenophaga sp.]